MITGVEIDMGGTAVRLRKDKYKWCVTPTQLLKNYTFENGSACGVTI